MQNLLRSSNRDNAFQLSVNNDLSFISYDSTREETVVTLFYTTQRNRIRNSNVVPNKYNRQKKRSMQNSHVKRTVSISFQHTLQWLSLFRKSQPNFQITRYCKTTVGKYFHDGSTVTKGDLPNKIFMVARTPYLIFSPIHSHATEILRIHFIVFNLCITCIFM